MADNTEPASPGSTTTTTGSTTEGRTRWGKALLMFVPGLVVVGALVIGMAEGAIATSFGVAGSQVKASFANLAGGTVTGYAYTNNTVKGGNEPLVLLGVQNASGGKMCMSTVLNVPIIGKMSLNIGAGNQVPVGIDGLTADATQLLTQNGKLTGATLGQDASTLNKNGLLSGAPAGAWGLQADQLTAQNLHLTAWTANAATLRLNGLSIAVHPGSHECF